MPQIIRGHTNSPTVMIAERAVDLMKGEVGGEGEKALQSLPLLSSSPSV
jgi:choline dehydrogenase-like flavoprotein